MKSLNKVFGLVLITLGVSVSYADVSHFFAPEFGFFQQPPQQHYHHQQQHPFQITALQPPPQPALPNLYAPPSEQQHQPGSGYPNPAAPTHAPVAPVFASTTEFTLPEIVENRIAKEQFNFIPLQSHYLPPEERPNYESPKPPAHHGEGYYYQRPTTSTTTERPGPIVVVDPVEFLPVVQPPSNQGPSQGYDYNAPSPVVVVPSRPVTPAPAYLPPAANGFAEDEDAALVEHSDANNPLRLRVKEMRCLPHQGGYFRSVLKVNSFIGAVPSVDNDSYDKRCELKLSRSYVVVDISEENFHKCGVRACGKDLCLRLRFPAIRGMRTSADAILTLHCKTQDRVAVKTHALKMGVTNDVQSRSIGTYAHGGSQNQFRTHVELLRKSSNGFTRHLEAEGAVQLGEDLLMRAHVLSGDGWNYTKLTDVSLQRISPSGELLNSADLITSQGCINPSMQSVCTQPPIFDPPLGHKLAFKAVMFQGMRSGDELVMSMRITGCLEQHDCQFVAQECGGGGGIAGLGRRKRNTMEQREAVLNGTEASEISRISFRVVMREGERVMDASDESETKADISASDVKVLVTQRSLILAGSVGFVVLLLGLGTFAMVQLRK